MFCPRNRLLTFSSLLSALFVFGRACVAAAQVLTIDLSGGSALQVSAASGATEYHGYPTTVLLPDGPPMYCAPLEETDKLLRP